MDDAVDVLDNDVPAVEEVGASARGLLMGICIAVGALLVVAGLIIYAISTVTDTSGAKSQGAMITCFVAALAAFAGASMVGGLLWADYE